MAAGWCLTDHVARLAIAMEQYTVHGRQGLIPRRIRPFSSQQIRAWREAEQAAGRSHSVEGFYLAYGVCPACAGEGVVMIGWRRPMNDAEQDSATALRLEELPMWDVCVVCNGSGKSQGSSNGR